MCDNDVHLDPDADPTLRRRLRTAVLVVALLNLAYFFVEIGVAVGIGSVSLFADSVDFLEDTAVNLLIFVALGFTLRWRSVMGKAMAILICVPAVAAAVSLILKAGNPEPPDPLSLTVTAGGAVLVNLACALILARFFDADFGLLAKGLVFVGAGLAFLVLNLVLLRRKGGAR